MIDTWFKKDIEKILNTHQIVVLVDESKEAGFLVEVVKDNYQLFNASTEIDELRIKFQIEKIHNNGGKFLIYTTTPKEQLKFIREYSETNGCIEIKYLQNYIKEKVLNNLNLNLHLDKEELISAAKVSIGKDQTYWMNLSHTGASEIFNLEKELLPFLDNPTSYLKKYDKNVQEIFFKKVNELIGQTYMPKPVATLATEVVTYLFDGLANNNPNKVLLEVYTSWLDSKSYINSLDRYLKKYHLSPKSDVFTIHPAHPFRSIDELWLEALGTNINNKGYIANFLPKINQRINNRAVYHLGISFWPYVKTLLEFDAKNINQLTSLEECVSFYTHHFYKLDRAIRGLYTEFLERINLIEPLQEFYKNYCIVFLEKWFRYIDSYQSNQTGKIQEILNSNDGKIAIIVGDGVSYEFAHDIIGKVSKDYSLSKDLQYMFAGLPSETEHNMSQLYVETGDLMKKKDREKYIAMHNQTKEIGFIDLQNVTELNDKDQYLICSYKDPDKLGESHQQKALKFFDTVSDTYATKIEQLFKNGYEHVYLVTDHGYVLTGLLTDSDKIEVTFNGKVDKSERYIRTEQSQKIDSTLLLEKAVKYDEYNYCYFAKRLGPFKTPGVYGFSHGGISPQETIIPFLKWSNVQVSQDQLQVSISNKAELLDVTGNLFSLKIKASASTGLFSEERKIIIVFYARGMKINESDIITIEKNAEIKKEYNFGSNNEIEIKILDALTMAQLDKITVKQNNARDLGGLM
jgi:hypothetical protein